MRTVLPGILLALATMLGGLALTAHTVAHTLLDPGRVGRVLSTAGAQVPTGELADQLVAEVASQAGLRPGELRRHLDGQLDPRLLEEVTVVGDTVDLTAVRDELAAQLRTSGSDRQARALDQLDPAELAVGGDLAGQVRAVTSSTRDKVTGFAATAAGWAALVALAAVALAANRRRALSYTGWSLVTGTGLTVALFLGLPWLLRRNSDSGGWFHTMAESFTVTGGNLAAPLVPFLVAGVALVAAVRLLPAPTPASSRGRAARESADPAATPPWPVD